MTSGFVWFVSKPGSADADDLQRYLSQGQWQAPNRQHVRDNVSRMQVGDRIALKATRNRVDDLPFFAGGRPASVMTIYATGSVTGINLDTGVIDVAWNSITAPRDWYFWTNLNAIWRVDPQSDDRSRQLVDFAFDEAPQDLDSFLDSDFWSDRYVRMPRFTWIPFYEEFASKLLAFREDRTKLVELVRKAAANEPRLTYMTTDHFLFGTSGQSGDIDPFTVMGAFNRKITKENRIAIAQLLGQSIGVSAAAPSDFHGVPILNNMRSCFVDYADNRGEYDISYLWDAFAAAINLSTNEITSARDEFIASYDRAHAVSGVRWNLSVGLYWARPYRFVTLDSQSRDYLKRHHSWSSPNDGNSYLQLCDSLLKSFARGSSPINSFPLLSYAAWSDSGDESVPHTLEGMALWIERLATSMDFEEIEHTEKRKVAELGRKARELAAAGDDEWTTWFSKALNATNTVDFRFKDTIKKLIARSPSESLAAFERVWAAPGPASLDSLKSDLQLLLGKVTPGNATALGAVLLMSVDAEGNAPYSTTRTDRWYELTGFQGPTQQDSPSDRYATMLTFLDALRGVLANEGQDTEPTRLEVQGMSWVVTEHDPPEDWSTDMKTELKAWRGDARKDHRAWLARSLTSGEQWLEDDYTSLSASYLGTLDPGSSLKDVKAAIEAGYQHQDYSQRKALVQEYFALLSVMEPGDLIATVVDGTLHVGVVDGPAHYVEDDGDRLRRRVLWEGSVRDNDLPTGIQAVLDRQGNIVDVTEALDELREVLVAGKLADTDSRPVLSRDEMLKLSPADEKLARELHMPQASLQEIIDLLASRQQIVLYGPPGTGKTFVAKALARHVIGPDDRSRMQLVQFHPSYAYEDFFEGYRPDLTAGGEATFSLQEGPLARIAREARENPGAPYVLIVDEMNRANLAKVFGELYFLLEYRNESINLQYRPDVAFRLPRNLFIIGTMNTADRSIALLDAAMRRRFSFVELHPDEAPVSGVLGAWLKEKNMSPQRAELLKTLNELIEDQDRDMRIGPSYLMRAEAETDEGLARVWKYDILPLLEEHYYGRLSRSDIHKRFGLDAIRSGTSRDSELSSDAEVEADELFEEFES